MAKIGIKRVSAAVLAFVVAFGLMFMGMGLQETHAASCSHKAKITSYVKVTGGSHCAVLKCKTCGKVIKKDKCASCV